LQYPLEMSNFRVQIHYSETISESGTEKNTPNTTQAEMHQKNENAITDIKTNKLQSGCLAR